MLRLSLWKHWGGDEGQHVQSGGCWEALLVPEDS